MLIRLLFWFLVFYVSFKFIIKVIIPVFLTTKNVRANMREMNEKMHEAHSNTEDGARNFNEPDAKTSAAKGDYIDFEEIK